LKFVLLFVLAALWAVVLVPPLLRARTGRSSDSIGDFNYHLGVLSRTNGHRRRGPRAARQLPVLSRPPVPSGAAMAAYAPRASAGQRAAKRRRDITLGLVVAATLTLAFGAIAQSSSVWLLHGFVDLLLIAYVGLLAWARQLQNERSANVRYLPPRRAPELALRPAPVALRRTASS
jgi:hypothetical protein